MAIVLNLHQVLSNTTWLFFLIVGVWGMYRAIRGFSVDGSYLGAMAVGEILFVVQGILGVVLLFGAGSPGRTTTP